MKCKVSTLLMLALALTTVLITGTIVNAKPLYGEMALDFMAPGPDIGYGPPVWSGTITGDINGEMYFYNTGSKDVGQAHHFWEVWYITTVDGDIIGTDKGVVSWANDKYRMNGVVTEAYGEYEHLIGHNVHMSGIITWADGTPETAPGEFRVN